MKIAPVLLGAVFAQSSGDSEEVFASDDRWDSWGSDNTFLVNSDEKQYQGTYNGTPKNVQAVTCWESNNMGDLSHFTTQNDDGFGWANIHHGHDQAANSITVTTDDDDYQVGTFVDGQTASSTNKLDLHSLLAYDNRYSGCIYEVADWVYDSNSYNVMWQVRFGADNAGAADGTGLDKSVEATGIRTNWWHYFNAHIVISDDTANDTNDAKKHYIAMANPSYEGLGYLNFIATFAKANNADFANGEWNTGRASNFNTQNTVTDLYSGGYAFEIIAGTSAGSSNWYSTYTPTSATAGTWVTFAAVSSFPHNDLGKDFRFNVRVLHKGGDGDPSSSGNKDSYYFYRINEIDIKFPYTVRCPREATNVGADSGTADTFRCMDSAGLNGHRAWNQATANTQATAYERENKAVYIETLSGGTIGANMCSSAQADGAYYKCGDTYNVEGLLNTYDEHGQQEFGTHQEFWFQFEYHFEFTEADLQAPNTNPQFTNSGTVTNADYRIYNLPNILFNAFELTKVDFVCSQAEQSRNRCN